MGSSQAKIAGDRLLLQPLAGVAGGDASVGGEFGLGGGPEIVERLVEPELQAQVDAERLQRVGRVIDEPLGERLASIQVGGGSHGSSLCHLRPLRTAPAPSVAPGAYSSRTGGVRRMYATSGTVIWSHQDWTGVREPDDDSTGVLDG